MSFGYDVWISWRILSGAKAEEGARGRATKGRARCTVHALEQVQAAFEKRKKEAEALKSWRKWLDFRSNA